MAEMRTYYDTLQVSRAASESVIKAAYRTLSQRYHPDKHPQRQEWANDQMKRLNEAYAVLSDSGRRAGYDAALEDAQKQARNPQEPRQGSKESTESSPRRRGGARDPAEFSSDQPSSSAQDHRWHDDGKDQTRSAPRYSAVVDVLNGLTARIESHNQKYEHLNIWGGRAVWAFLLIYCSYELARKTANKVVPGFEKIGIVDALAWPGFWGMLVPSAAALSITGAIFWTAAWILRKPPRSRVSAATIGLFIGFAVLLFGEVIGKDRARRAAQGTEVVESSARSAGPSIQADHAADSVVLNRERASLRLRHPVINPQMREYSLEADRWVDGQISKYAQQGSPPSAAVRQAEADLKAALEEQAVQTRRLQEQQQQSAANYMPPSSEEKLTMDMACNEFQLSGNIVGYRSCVERQQALHRATGTTPSYSDLSSDEAITIQMACDSQQLSGDLAGYKSCIRAQLSKIGR